MQTFCWHDGCFKPVVDLPTSQWLKYPSVSGIRACGEEHYHASCMVSLKRSLSIADKASQNRVRRKSIYHTQVDRIFFFFPTVR